MAYKILVDSAADLPRETALKAGITVLPMTVNIEGKTFLEGIDIFPDEFYSRFHSFKELPKTSQPNINLLLEYYEKILATGDELIAIHLSSELSSTYNTAQMVKEMCSFPERVHIVDSRNASLGSGFLALAAAEIVKECDSWGEIEKKINDHRSRIRSLFTPDKLEYLIKGGRVSKTSGFIGTLLDVKPVLHVTPEGRLEPLAKVRSRKAALRKLVDIMEEEIVAPEKQVIGISHSNCMEDVQTLMEEIRQRMAFKDILIADIGCVIGSHTGPGNIALFYRK